MQRICTTLVNNGFDVLLVGRELKRSQPLTPRLYKQKRIHCKFEVGMMFYLEYNIRLFLFLMRQDFHVVSAADLDTLAAAGLVKVIRNKLLVFDAHEYFVEVPELIGKEIKQAIWNFVADTFIPLANAAYTVGPVLASLFSKQHAIKFECVMNVPIQTSVFEGSTQKQQVILYQGALNQGRGLEVLIGAMKNVDAMLWIAGEGDLSESLRALTKELGVDSKVQFLGWVEPAKLKKITREVMIGVNLLEPIGLSYYYSLANKFFDYMHAGVPQLCADFPEYAAMNESFEVACLIKLTELSVQSALNKLLTDVQFYQLLQTNALAASKVYSWQNEEQKLIQLYERCI